jgi:hypothetical protein
MTSRFEGGGVTKIRRNRTPFWILPSPLLATSGKILFRTGKKICIRKQLRHVISSLKKGGGGIAFFTGTKGERGKKKRQNRVTSYANAHRPKLQLQQKIKISSFFIQFAADHRLVESIAGSCFHQTLILLFDYFVIQNLSFGE